MKNSIGSYLKSRKFLAHIIMLIFALASLNNIRGVIYDLKGDIRSAWLAGIALGLALVVMAAMLSECEWKPHDRKFKTILGVTVLLTLLSGIVQGYGFYNRVGFIGVFFGLMFPALGELGIALAISSYNEILENRNIDDAKRHLANGVRDAISESIQDLDRDKIQNQVERAAAKITSKIVEATVQEMAEELGATVQDNAAQQSNVAALKDQLAAALLRAEAAESPQIEAAYTGDAVSITQHEAARDTADNAAMRQHLAASGVLGTGELAALLKVSPDTVRRRAASDDAVTSAGRGKWRVVEIPDLGIPQHEPAEPYTNGVHA